MAEALIAEAKEAKLQFNINTYNALIALKADKRARAFLITFCSEYCTSLAQRICLESASCCRRCARSCCCRRKPRSRLCSTPLVTGCAEPAQALTDVLWLLLVALAQWLRAAKRFCRFSSRWLG